MNDTVDYGRAFWARHHRRIPRLHRSLAQLQAIIDRRVYGLGWYGIAALCTMLANASRHAS